MLTFDAKSGPLGGLADAGEDVELQVGAQSLDQADGGGALSLPQGGGGDAGGRKRIIKNTFLASRGLQQYINMGDE